MHGEAEVGQWMCICFGISTDDATLDSCLYGLGQAFWYMVMGVWFGWLHAGDWIGWDQVFGRCLHAAQEAFALFLYL